MPVSTCRDSHDRTRGSPRGSAKGPAFYARRAALSGAIIAGQLSIVLIALYSNERGAAQPPERRLVAIDISAATEPSLPAAPAKQTRVSPLRTMQLVRRENTMPALPPPEGSGSRSSCAMTAVVARAISTSPNAMAALAALPAGLRTEADAVMLWNGEWLLQDEPISLTTAAPEHPMEPLKQVVLDAVRTMPPECLEVETSGPQLIPIAEPGRTTMLVVGSGRWRWSSLTAELGNPTAAQQAVQAGVWWPVGFPFTGN